jgi:hypothetical protein
MTEDARFAGVEEQLRAAGRPAAPPAGYLEVARTAALGEVPPGARVIGLPVRHRFSAFRALLAAAVIAISVAGALVIGVGGDSRMQVEHSVALSGSDGASGSVDIGTQNGPLRDVVLKVDGLEPAPDGRYYQMWFSYGGDSMAIMAFNTSSDGTVEVRSSMPAGMGWQSCWVTLEGGDGTQAATVLRAS